jgi:hypothetical protein
MLLGFGLLIGREAPEGGRALHARPVWRYVGGGPDAMPRNSRLDRFKTPADLLGYEIIQEQASALGRLGRALEAALTKLREFDAAHPQSGASPAERQTRCTLVTEAGYALWMFVVQREACGLRDSRSIVRDYGVPSEVLNRMGALPTERP